MARGNELNGVNSSESCSLEDGWMDGWTDGQTDGWIDSQKTLLMCRSCIAWQKLQLIWGHNLLLEYTRSIIVKILKPRIMYYNLLRI